VNVTPGTLSVPEISLISFPLTGTASASGQMIGRFTAVTPNSLTNSSAGWTASALSTAATPHCIRITSGAAEGRTFLISTQAPNTSTTVTIDTDEASLVDLTSLGIATGPSGDTYEIIPCDTISSIFGTPATTGVLGGTTFRESDMLMLFTQGTWKEFFYHTPTARWVRVVPQIAANNVPIRPDAAVLYHRRGSAPLSFTVSGRVPSTARQVAISNSGVTFLAASWPVDQTLLQTRIHQIPGWISGAFATSDYLMVLVSGTWREYYYDGAQWKRMGFSSSSNNFIIPAGSAVILNKRGTSPAATTLTQPVPYTF